MKKRFLSIFLILFNFLLICSNEAESASPAKIAVLPFKINAKEDLNFLKDGIQDMLSSRLSWEDKVTVIERQTVNRMIESTAKLTDNMSRSNLALLVGSKLNADYVIDGSITLLGQNASIDTKITDVTGQTQPVSIFKNADTIDQIIPEINRTATEINSRIFKRPQKVEFDESLPDNPPSSSSPQQKSSLNQNSAAPAGESAFIKRDANLNFWSTRDIKELISGMIFADVNNDGIKELIYISDHEVVIGTLSGRSFREIMRTGKHRVNQYLAVDAGDINKNGIPEIFVSALTANKSEISSFALEFNGSGYKKLLNRSPYIYRIVSSPGKEDILLGQQPVNYTGGQFKMQSHYGIFGSEISTMENIGNNEYKVGRRLLDSGLANVLGVVTGSMDESGKNFTLAFDQLDYIKLFNNNQKILWTATDKLGGGANKYLINSDTNRADDRRAQYFPTRIILSDVNSDGKNEIITCANHDIAQNLVQGFRSFSKSRMIFLTCDSLGPRPIWESRQLSGRISDFFIDDIDNDDSRELVVSLIKKEQGAFISSTAVSMIVVFEL